MLRDGDVNTHARAQTQIDDKLADDMKTTKAHEHENEQRATPIASGLLQTLQCCLA